MKKQLLTKALLGAVLAVAGGNKMQAQSLNFGSDLEESLAVGQSHRTVPIFCDFNNDGIMDIYYGGCSCINGEWGTPSTVALNKGNNEWDLVEQDFKTSWGYGSKAIDFDQDGLVDFLFLTGAEGDTGEGFGLRLIRNEGNGKLSLVEDECLAGLNLTHENDNHKNNRSNPWQSLSIGDYDKDGYPDILIMGSAADGSRVMKLLHNKAGQGFEATDFSLSMDHGTVWLADFTGDGWVDIFATGWCDGEGMGWVSLLFENKHDGTFENISEYAFGSNAAYGFEGAGENAVQVLDYNQDGNLDIFLMGSLRSFDDKNWSGKTAFILKNDGTGKFSEEVTNIMAISGAAERFNFMADFNGDGYVDYVGKGWGADKGDWAWSVCSSTGLDQYTYNHDNPNIYESEGNMAIGDWNNDGLLDFVLGNAWTDYGSQLVFSSNKTEGITVLKPTAPTEVEATYDAATKALNVTWENGTMSSGSKPFYNLYLKNKETGKTFTIAPANLELGTQSAYTEFSVYVQGTSYTFENVEAGNYEVGVQSVTYSWQASTFNSITINTDDFTTGINATSATQETTDVYTLSGILVKKGAKVTEALEGLSKGIYVVNGKKIIK